MTFIKGVMLLPLEAGCYRRHVAHHTFVAKVNSAATVPDPANALAAIVEERVRDALRHYLVSTGYRILRWEQLNHHRRYIECFQELDGVFATSDGCTVVVEVKASVSSSSRRTGLKQLRRSLRIIAARRPDPIGLLVCGDLSKWSARFVGAGPQTPEEHFALSGLERVDWPPRIRPDHCGCIVTSMIPCDIVDTWITASAPPPESRDASSSALTYGEDKPSTLGDTDSGKILARLFSSENERAARTRLSNG